MLDNKQEIIKSLYILGINSAQDIYIDCIKDFHKKKYYKIFYSKLSKEEKNNLLIEINNAKEILDKISTDDLFGYINFSPKKIKENNLNKNRINKNKLNKNKYRFFSDNKKDIQMQRLLNFDHKYIKKPTKIKRKKITKFTNFLNDLKFYCHLLLVILSIPFVIVILFLFLSFLPYIGDYLWNIAINLFSNKLYPLVMIILIIQFFLFLLDLFTNYD